MVLGPLAVAHDPAQVTCQLRGDLLAVIHHPADPLGRVEPGLDAFGELHLLLGVEQRDLADLLEVGAYRVRRGGELGVLAGLPQGLGLLLVPDEVRPRGEGRSGAGLGLLLGLLRFLGGCDGRIAGSARPGNRVGIGDDVGLGKLVRHDVLGVGQHVSVVYELGRIRRHRLEVDVLRAVLQQRAAWGQLVGGHLLGRQVGARRCLGHPVAGSLRGLRGALGRRGGRLLGGHRLLRRRCASCSPRGRGAGLVVHGVLGARCGFCGCHLGPFATLRPTSGVRLRPGTTHLLCGAPSPARCRGHSGHCNEPELPRREVAAFGTDAGSPRLARLAR